MRFAGYLGTFVAPFGVLLISQKISNFGPAMRSAMNISIIFRTKYEGDLDSISRTLGSDWSEIIPSLPIGFSVFHSADIASPFVIAGNRCIDNHN